MSAGRLRFVAIGVHRMPGVRRGQGFELDDLGPGINVVFGPNGSGKTTVARAMQEVLWPGSDPSSSPSLTATLALGESTWQAELEGRIVRWFRDGVEVSPPDVGGADARHRYRLALAELVAGTRDDALFADEIDRAVVGGFDLEEVRRRGGFAERPAGRGNSQKEVDEAHRALEGAIRNEAGLQQRSTLTLSELRRALVEANRAVSLKTACDKAIEQKNAGDEVERLERERDSLPLDRLGACHANDLQTLDGLEREIGSHEKEHRDLTRERDESARTIGEIDLGGEGIPSATIERLEELVAELESDEQELAGLRGEVPKSRAERDSCLARLENEFSPAQLEALDTSLGVPEAEEFARSSHELAGRRASVRASRARLAPLEQLDSVADTDTLREGRQILAYWMAEPEVGVAAEMVKRHRVAVALLAILGAGLAVALSWLHHPLWSIASAPLALLAWLALRSGADRPGGPRAQRAAFRAKYAKLELPQPEAWTVDGVTESLREIERELDAARETDAQRRQHAELDHSERDLRDRERGHDARRAQLEARLGFALPAGQGWLPVLASNLLRWQAASDGLSAAESRIDDVRRRIASLLEQAERLVHRYAQPNPESAAAVRRSITRLEELARAFHARAKAESTLAGRIEPALAAARRARSDFFARRGLEEGDRQGLQALLAAWKELRALEGRIHEARGAARQAAAGVVATEDLADSSVDELKLRRDEYAAKAARHNETLKEISKIEHEIEEARRGHEVTDARHRLERANDALCRLRDDEGERAVGQALLEQVRTRARESSVPEVFDRARRILARITAGRFELRLPTAGEGSFRAYDTSDGFEKALDELSTGERVQLLLAVRLGFLEHQERDRLPLLLDETLGTSDDARVREILDALIEVARAGRQIIYFTAQHDEAGKWAARLEGEDVPFKLIDLGAKRSGDRALLTPLEIRPLPTARIPAPEGRGHAEYGRLLGVAGLDPHQGSIDRVHLWHAVEDCDQLHALLSRKIETIGQFRTYRRYSGEVPRGVDPQTEQRIEAATAALKLLFDAWRRGRPTPIDLEIVLATDTVSERFESRVAELLAELDHDPARLLVDLEQGRIKGFRRESTRRMREALEELGVLDDREPLSAAELSIRLDASLTREFETGVLDESWVRRVVATLPAVPD